MIHLRPAPSLQAPSAPELPRDIVWLRRGTAIALALLCLALLGIALRALAISPWFAVQGLRVTGSTPSDAQFHNELTLRANVLSQLSGNYFSVNLRQAQRAFEALPWIRSAVVQREFPNQLHAHLTAHVAAARWSSIDEAQASEGEHEVERLVNVQGEVFEASGGAIDTESLPLLVGPKDQAAELLDAYLALKPALQAHHFELKQLSLSAQGLWQARLDNQAILALGSGRQKDITERVQRWLKAWPSVIEKYGPREALAIDLRYREGFAVRLAGITTR